MTKTKKYAQLTQPQLTTGKLWTVFVLQANEAYQIYVLYPFVVFMIRDFDFDEHSVGTYAGILSGTFCISQFCSSFLWGWSSDIYGRKICLIIGTFAGMIAMCSLGFAKNYYFAIGSRVIGGLFNGNIGVLKSYLADITNENNRSYAFSIMAIGWGVGTIIGSIAGGLLVDINNFWVFSENYTPSEYSFPYLLPCLIGSFIALIGFIFTIIFIQDVKKLDKKHTGNNNNKPIMMGQTGRNWIDMDTSATKESIMDFMERIEVSPSYGMESDKTADNISRKKKKSNNKKENRQLLSKSMYGSIDSNVLLPSSNVIMSLLSIDSVSSSSTDEDEGDLYDEISDPNEFEYNTTSDMFKHTYLLLTLINQSFVNGSFIILGELFPIYTAEYHEYGGLEFNALDIGIVLGISGIILAIFAFKIQPKITEMFGLIKPSILSNIIMIFIVIALPSLQFLTGILNKIYLIILSCILMCFRSVLMSIIGVTCFILVNNCVPPSFVGKANGLAQSIASFVRGIGPTIAGILWSWSTTQTWSGHIYPAFLCSAILFVGDFIILCKFPKKIEKPWEIHKNKF